MLDNTLIQLRKQLYTMNVCVKLVKIEAHSGIAGNVIADQHAKATSLKMFKGIISTLERSISLSDAYNIAAEIAIKSWQRFWDNESTGRYTYELIPTVGTKLCFPIDRDTGISYCRMMLHDTMLKQDSHRSGTSDSSMCDCGMEEESVEHFLLRCKTYNGIRSVMFNNIEDLISKYLDNTVIEFLLLAPPADNNIGKSDGVFIKQALFEFILSSNQKL